jgi:CubicO group peptidase (beta-lactamase class C family)
MARGFERVTQYLQGEIDEGAFPGAQYVIGEGGEVIAEGSLGHAVVEPEAIPVTNSTIFDIASLTKPLVTSMLAVILAERGKVDLSSRASEYLAELATVEDKRSISVVQLLTHTSGLQRWLPFFRELSDKGQMVQAIAASALELNGSSPRAVTYSDLNYILLGLLLERVTGESLDRIAQREIFTPLRLTRTFFNPADRLRREIAATEIEAGEDGAAGKVTWGAVHDHNARFMGGVSGHAGLFSSSREVFKLACQFLPGSKLVSDLSVALFTENLTRGETSRSVAWVLGSSLDCSAGPALPPEAMGHNGFTGTSVWIDPIRKRVFVLLTNRLHRRPVVEVDMKLVRQRFNTLAVEELDQKK